MPSLLWCRNHAPEFWMGWLWDSRSLLECGSSMVQQHYFFLVGISRFRSLSGLRRLGVVLARSGLTLIMALIASSKLNGCREIGFAFGIENPLMASLIARIAR